MGCRLWGCTESTQLKRLSSSSRVHHEKCWAGRSTSWNQGCRRNISNLTYADDTTLMAESEEELKSLSMRVKEESEKADLKFNIKKTRIMAFGSITSWQTEGKKVEAVTDFIFFDLKIIMGSDCSHEIKRPLLLRRKAMPNLNSILKKIQRHHFADRGLYSQRCGFSRSRVWI